MAHSNAKSPSHNLRFVVRLFFLLILLFAPSSSLDMINQCPEEWPFEYCPRENDTDDHVVCCLADEEYSCCLEDHLREWLIFLVCIFIAVAFIGMLVMIAVCCGFCTCLTCCHSYFHGDKHSRRPRNEVHVYESGNHPTVVIIDKKHT
ncbi:uncharacterized protein [Ptychodera flava]|uniref:uncharacterized protein n=1 Tax=Ptychodera flava TaxID=63121 RepID=UPI00396A8CB7